jgi:DNA-binding winged helix-turn-helix (wHTH) protein
MPEIGPDHPLTYRQAVVAPLFARIRARDSCAIIGASSMGKSRLVHFIMRSDVQAYMLGEQPAAPRLVLADCNRLANVSEWGLYELLLTALIEACGSWPDAAALRAQLNALRHKVITSRSALLARRHSELAVHMVCQEQGQPICLLLDEFDEAYRTLPALALANLRALRDANKYQLCYVVLLREHPAQLRDPNTCEGLYELFSRSIFGLGPYAAEDARRIVEQIEARTGHTLSQARHAQLIQLSGGHPGLILALFDAMLVQSSDTGDDWLGCGLKQPTIREECRKLWDGLAEDEQLALLHVVHGVTVDGARNDILLLKGLLRQGDDPTALFSPLFTQFVLTEAVAVDQTLWIDEGSRVVRRGSQQIKGLTSREFDLLIYLSQHAGQVCTRDEILVHLYPEELRQSGDPHNRVDTLVKRLRKRIEPLPQNPRYILTVRNKGYKLAHERR